MVEVLTPDFLGDPHAIDRVIESQPEVFNHNTETVPRFYKKVRGRADYQRSLDLLARVKAQGAAHHDEERPDARPGRDARRNCSTCWPICVRRDATC